MVGFFRRYEKNIVTHIQIALHIHSIIDYLTNFDNQQYYSILCLKNRNRANDIFTHPVCVRLVRRNGEVGEIGLSEVKTISL